GKAAAERECRVARRQRWTRERRQGVGEVVGTSVTVTKEEDDFKSVPVGEEGGRWLWWP
ncbi:hypothetical protein L195_g029724, partial [Trifolium pratense]